MSWPSQLRIRSAALRRRASTPSRVVDGVGEALAHLLVHLAVNVGLHGQHVVRRQPVAAVERFVDALDAIGIDPLSR